MDRIYSPHLKHVTLRKHKAGGDSSTGSKVFGLAIAQTSDTVCRVGAIAPGTPAARHSLLCVGDRLLAVNGMCIAELAHSYAAESAHHAKASAGGGASFAQTLFVECSVERNCQCTAQIANPHNSILKMEYHHSKTN